MVSQVAGEVKDPETGLTLLGRIKARAIVTGSKDALQGEEMRIGALGSGSDYTSFLQHIGVGSLNVGMGGEGGDGIYHSTYDSFDHYTRFNDPDFKYGEAL